MILSDSTIPSVAEPFRLEAINDKTLLILSESKRALINDSKLALVVKYVDGKNTVQVISNHLQNSLSEYEVRHALSSLIAKGYIKLISADRLASAERKHHTLDAQNNARFPKTNDNDMGHKIARELSDELSYTHNNSPLSSTLISKQKAKQKPKQKQINVPLPSDYLEIALITSPLFNQADIKNTIKQLGLITNPISRLTLFVSDNYLSEQVSFASDTQCLLNARTKK